MLFKSRNSNHHKIKIAKILPDSLAFAKFNRFRIVLHDGAVPVEAAHVSWGRCALGMPTRTVKNPITGRKFTYAISPLTGLIVKV